MIVVKLMKFGAKVEEYPLDTGSTVDSLFRAAGKPYVQGSVTRNGSVVNSGTPLYNNDKLFIGDTVKGNLDPFEVTFLPLGGRGTSLVAEDGNTIKQTLDQLSETERAKFYRADGKSAYEFRIGNSRQLEDTHVLSRDQMEPGASSLRVICSQRVKGN
jgi:hypothetical protein